MDPVQFNVGGSIYKISRSLLDSHSNSMLSRCASQQWQKDPESEIFIERDGSIFRFVLSYMRDGRVFLPITESKEALLAELVYYGIDVFDESQISDADMRKATCIKSLREAVKDFEDTCTKKKNLMEDAELEYRCSKYALDVLTAFVSQGDYVAEEIGFNFDRLEKRENVSQLLKMNKHSKIKEMVDDRLCGVGLKLSVFNAVCGSKYLDVRAKLIDPCKHIESKSRGSTTLTE